MRFCIPYAGATHALPQAVAQMLDITVLGTLIRPTTLIVTGTSPRQKQLVEERDGTRWDFDADGLAANDIVELEALDLLTINDASGWRPQRMADFIEKQIGEKNLAPFTAPA